MTHSKPAVSLPRRAVTQFALLLSGALLAGRAAWAATAAVSIENFAFTPRLLTVVAGTTVTWTNGDDIPHNVMSTEEAFRSPVLDTDEHFAFTFTTPGDYAYFCGLHPHMTGQVSVTPGQG